MIDRAAEEEAAQRRAAQAQHQYTAPTGDTQDRAGRGNEKETGGTGALRYRQMFIQSVPGAPERLRDGQIRGLMCLASQGQGRAELSQTTAQVLHKSMKRTIASV